MRHTIYFIRHGETDWNRQKRLQGTKDISLNDTGRLQARDNGLRLKKHLREHDIPFVTSPLKRARETMELIREELGLIQDDYILEPKLKEISFGVNEGYTIEEIKKRSPEKEAERLKDKWQYRVTGGESYAMLEDRVQSWLEGMKKNVVVVSHGMVSRVLRKILLGLSEVDAVKLSTPQDKIMRISSGEIAWL